MSIVVDIDKAYFVTQKLSIIEIGLVMCLCVMDFSEAFGSFSNSYLMTVC